MTETRSADELTGVALDTIWGDNVGLVYLANSRRESIQPPPAQSNFRVFAILLVTSPTGRRALEGTNSEPGCYIGGSICAERSALMKLRFIPDATIAKVVVVSDHTQPISPGALCREFLISFGTRATTVVMGNNDGEVITQCFLGDLYPFPSIYRFQTAGNIGRFAGEFYERSTKMRKVLDPEVFELYKHACKFVDHEKDGPVHPLKLAAAVLYSDGSVEAAVQLKGAEFGCSLDPVSQLVGMMFRKTIIGDASSSSSMTLCAMCASSSSAKAHRSDENEDEKSDEKASTTVKPSTAGAKQVGSERDGGRDAEDNLGSTFGSSTYSGTYSETFNSTLSSSGEINVAPVKGSKPVARYLVMVDQYRIAHAPPAQARALLIEHGFADVIVVLHNERGGVEQVKAAALLPAPPGVNLLTHDNFI